MTTWNGSQARRVCDACFGGDLDAFIAHARAYVEGGHEAVRPLRAEFRAIVLKQNRTSWWQRALRAAEAERVRRLADAADEPGDEPVDESDPRETLTFCPGGHEHGARVSRVKHPATGKVKVLVKQTRKDPVTGVYKIDAQPGNAHPERHCEPTNPAEVGQAVLDALDGQLPF